MADWNRCYFCGHHAGSWRDGQGGRKYSITAPDRISGKIKQGDDWTCSVCIRLGRPQVFGRAESEKQKLKRRYQ